MGRIIGVFGKDIDSVYFKDFLNSESDLYHPDIDNQLPGKPVFAKENSRC